MVFLNASMLIISYAVAFLVNNSFIHDLIPMTPCWLITTLRTKSTTGVPKCNRHRFSCVKDATFACGWVP